jgi:Phage tail-collar fibre protein
LANTGFKITDAGLAAASIASPSGPHISITQFRVGAGFNYVPTGLETALAGAILYTGVPSSFSVVDADTIECLLVMDNTIGPFNFGEIGIYLSDGTLFAVSVFSTLQEKLNAVGNLTGSRYVFRARLRYAQLPAICEVTITNSNSLLEVPNWESLVPPIDQISGANAAIVHDNNYSGDPVLVIRDTNTEWAPIGYSRIFLGNTSFPGASITTTTLTHPNLSQFNFQLPATDSRYLIKFPNGLIRKISAQPTATSLTFGPAIVALTGTFSIWEDNSIPIAFRVAGRFEYNALATLTNRYWSTPSGTYAGTNAGLNQVALPTLVSGFPTIAQWDSLRSALYKTSQIHNVVLSAIPAAGEDYRYKPDNADGSGITTLLDKYYGLRDQPSLIEPNRNTVDVAATQTSAILALDRSRTTPWGGIVSYFFDLNYASNNERLGSVNGGAQFNITGDVPGNTSIFWNAWDLFTNAIGVIRVQRGDTVSSLAYGTGTSVGLANMPGVFTLLYSASYVSVPLGTTLDLALYGRQVGNGYNFQLDLNSPGSPYVYSAGGLMTIAVSARRPSGLILTTPVLAYPTGIQQASTF